ncbi:MAG: muconolactone Delta-isomerase family protein [Candidatus Velthaea sp.]
MAKFLALLKRDYERFTEADFTPLLEPEAQAARTLYSEGIARAVYGRGDVPGAVIELEAASAEEARAALMRLPFLEKGMLALELIPLGPYRGFGPRT